MLVKTASDAKEILKGRLDMMKTARDKTGIDVDLHEHMETAVNSVQKRKTGNKKYLWVHGLLPNGDPHCSKAQELGLLCGPDSRWASTGERIGEAKSEEIFDYLIHVLKEKGLRKG